MVFWFLNFLDRDDDEDEDIQECLGSFQDGIKMQYLFFGIRLQVVGCGAFGNLVQ